MIAAFNVLDTLVFLLDPNGPRFAGSNDVVLSLGDIEGKFRAFGFEVSSIVGDDVGAITAALKQRPAGRPRFIECRTTKGRGVSFMENNFAWHGKAPNREEYERAIKELET